MQRSTPYLIPIILLIIGFSGLVFAIRDSLGGLRSLRWPSVQGEVLSAEPDRRPGSESATGWRPLVRYAYSVDGSPHRGAKLTMARPRRATKEKVESMLARYSPGSAVDVFYNPAKPAESCLEPGPQYPFLITCLAASLFSLAVALWWSRRIRDTLRT